ncbi:MAG: DinB family protein [Flavobacteriaceae bacterium]|nr:DinB family protein [Flavobacteriaceae bacterium]
MNTSAYLTHRLREVLTSGKWVTGTNFKAQILNTSWKDAIVSIDGLNSIAKLTFHIHYYIEGVTKVLEGGPLEIRDAYSFNAPPIQSEADWKDLTHKFCVDSEKFIALVEKMTDGALQDIFVDEKYGNYQRNIDVMMEHTYYHLGQILLIKKLINKRRKTSNL